MTEKQIKEAISREFLRILALGHGFKVIEPSPDHGVDIVIYPVMPHPVQAGKSRYLDSQHKLDFQVKATTLAGVIDMGDFIKFDLEVKNYNDLVYRRNDMLPLHLVVAVLDSSPPNCLSVDDRKLCLACTGYWFLPEEGARTSLNARQVRITIPKTNRLESGFVRDRFVQLGLTHD
ncbi:DUF4365 domain-containing protein [Massilia rubra]|uniref:DUF4365 domain-containing protein n=1 Tax=Massilia rubra TaxID=2607910 RepID=A0ABX0LS67_9BURK|nr:DUF4365 domain-containing protein [Massilia rubra]NHZ36834.1 DUF4365 domain-containing protein [Massilia rubra]